jgi:hypothetical protein
MKGLLQILQSTHMFKLWRTQMNEAEWKCGGMIMFNNLKKGFDLGWSERNERQIGIGEIDWLSGK